MAEPTPTETESTTLPAGTIRELVGVRPHPTVVRLEQLDSAGAEWITSAYHITSDVESHLRALRSALSRASGCGAFLIGQYGSGKSHFLGYVARSLETGQLVDTPPAVVTVSLLNYRADHSLEDVVREALDLPETRDRREAWTSVPQRYPRGLFLIVDELSEFLRSKADSRQLNEDVRYLQFLGEWCQEQRFWVIAAMQEQIEHTGDLEHGLYRKIKDRFPLCFLLSPAHVRDLLAESILVKRQGYEAATEKLARDVRQAFEGLELAYDDLRRIYPLHPATLELLEEVRDQFSQARGVVDFTVTRLAGDETRGVEPFLDERWGSLLTPDSIVEHFRDLFEVQPEFTPVAQRLLPYYRKHLAELFPKEDLRKLARSLLHLLVLVHLSPQRTGLSAREAASWLLYRVTRIDPERNLAVIERTLEKLARAGRYVVARGDRFHLELEDDGSAALEKLVAREKAELLERGDIVFEVLAPLVSGAEFDPLSLPREEWQSRSVRWHLHERSYAVFLGDEPPTPPRDGGPAAGRIALCVCLPWGAAAPSRGYYTVVPSRLERSDDILELAALSRAAERPWSGAVVERLAVRLRERTAVFRKQIQNAYLAAEVWDAEGNRLSPPHVDPSSSFGGWLDSMVRWILRRTFPGFEKFAPTHGPLPKEAYRRFLRFAGESDLGSFDADEYVKLIREAYLLPMKLMQRQGRDYAIPKNLEANELVRRLQPLIDNEPSPKLVYEHLAEPIYGLVPDQVSLLLIFLLVLGEIDIVKDRKSYRDCYETLPNPLQYDKIVPGSALGFEQLRDLEKLCEGLGVRAPKQWTVLGQRRLATKLREVARQRCEPLEALLLRLQNAAEGRELADRLRRVVSQWRALEKGDDEIQGLRQFLYEIGSPGRFLATLGEVTDLPQRIDKLLTELERFRHLLVHPALAEPPDRDVAVRLSSLESPPGLDQPDALKEWLEKAKAVYEEYKADYVRRHEGWWQTCSAQPIWTWSPPALASSRHVGLEKELAEIRAARQGASERRCRGLVNLDFQPVCGCGFDGETSPITTQLETFERCRRTVEETLVLFFRRDDVRSRLREWVRQGLEVTPGLLAYLDGKKPLPDLADVSRFDRYLAGVELIKEVDEKDLLEVITARTWERRALLSALETFLERYGSAQLRFRRSPGVDVDDLAPWCIEQALRTGVPLPVGFGEAALAPVVAKLDPSCVSESGLENLEKLRLGDAVIDGVVRWLIDGQVPLPQRSPEFAAAPLLRSVFELLRPSDPANPGEFAALARGLYRNHRRMMRVAAEPWIERLRSLARWKPREAPPELTALLEGEQDAQWLLVDGLGLPIADTFRRGLPEFLPDWREERSGFATVSTRTTTDECLRRLAESGIEHALEKVNCVDDLIHARFVGLDDLERLASAELVLRLREIDRRLDRTRPLLVFADHGFRIAPDGRSYQHGGPSSLERIVPVFWLRSV